MNSASEFWLTELVVTFAEERYKITKTREKRIDHEIWRVLYKRP